MTARIVRIEKCGDCLHFNHFYETCMEKGAAPNPETPRHCVTEEPSCKPGEPPPSWCPLPQEPDLEAVVERLDEDKALRRREGLKNYWRLTPERLREAMEAASRPEGGGT